MILGSKRFLFVFVFIFSTNLFAGDDPYDVECHVEGKRITLDYDGESFRDQSILDLRDVVAHKCPAWLKGSFVRLENVSLVSRARDEHAIVNLEVGRYRSRAYHLFEDYQVVEMNGPLIQFGRLSWKLHFRGKVRVKTIILLITKF